MIESFKMSKSKHYRQSFDVIIYGIFVLILLVKIIKNKFFNYISYFFLIIN